MSLLRVKIQHTQTHTIEKMQEGEDLVWRWLNGDTACPSPQWENWMFVCMCVCPPSCPGLFLLSVQRLVHRHEITSMQLSGIGVFLRLNRFLPLPPPSGKIS
uniref:Uncharacterized protein n=1 Tax=Micrurus corallinus TaxID=54390 RepID=A0A2D4FBV6_MICCO